MKDDWSRRIRSALVLAIAPWAALLSESLTVQGKVQTINGPVRLARVSMWATSDSATKWTSLTDTSGWFRFDIVTGIGDNDITVANPVLGQSYPNPFSSNTTIPCYLGQTSGATLRIFDLLGKEVKNVHLDGEGREIDFRWDGTNQSGARVAAGVYFVVLRSGRSIQSQKLLFTGSARTVVNILSGKPVQAMQWTPHKSESGPQAGMYVVRLEPTDSTSPPFLACEYQNLWLAGDTTLILPVVESEDFALCYVRPNAGRGQIYLNNILGTHPRNISQYPDSTDDYPIVSWNGRHVAFQRSRALWGPATMTLDLFTGSSFDLTSDGGLSASRPFWTPDDYVCLAYQTPRGGRTDTYLLDSIGGSKRKILDSTAASVFFFDDGNRFVYVKDQTIVHLTTLNHDSDVVVCDLSQEFGGPTVAQDFDSHSEELLLVYVNQLDTVPTIATYNVVTRTKRDRFIGDKGYQFYQVRYSEDCTRIAAVEHSEDEEILSVIQDSVRQRYVRIPTAMPLIRFSFNPMRFSRSGNLLAFSKMHFLNGSWVSWTERLYILDLTTSQERVIDIGWYPSWIRE